MKPKTKYLSADLLCDWLQNVAKQTSELIFYLSLFSSFDKTKVLCLLLHSADLGHAAKQWELHYQWTAR